VRRRTRISSAQNGSSDDGMGMLALPLCVAAAAAAAFAPLGGMEMDSTSYVITWANKTSGWCVDLTGGSTANGTEVQLWDCNVRIFT